MSVKIGLSLMEMEPDDLQYGGRSPECIGMSLDVKLAFGRVCSLIESLKDDIGEEAASYQLLRIRNDINRVLKKKRDKELFKQGGCHNGVDTTGYAIKGLHNNHPVINDNLSVQQTFSHPHIGNASYFANGNEIASEISFDHNTEDKKEYSRNHLQPNDGVNNSLFSNNNEKLYTSFSSSFRPISHKNIKDPHRSVQLGTIMEENRFEVVNGADCDNDSEGDDGNEDEEETNTGSSYFFLKSWSVLRREKHLLLTGIKMNEKGDIIEKDFVSKKVISRKEKDTVKTEDGEFVLQGLLVDPKKIIPNKIKNYFSEEATFPRCWKKVLLEWLEIDKKKVEEKVRKRSVSPKKKIMLDKSISNNLKKKEKSPGTKKFNVKAVITTDKDKSSNVKKQRKEAKLSTKELKENSVNKKIKKNKAEQKNNQKKNKESPALLSSDQKRGGNKKITNVEEHNEAGPFSEILGDESLFLLPTSSLTPNGLLGSIKKNVIKGRYTPPTSMFDNVYGTKSDNNSSFNTSLEDIGVKNNHVVKRMCKVNNKTNLKKSGKSPKRVMEENEAINEILQAAKAKTNTTPSIMKQVFSAERKEDSVNFSDLSEAESG